MTDVITTKCGVPIVFEIYADTEYFLKRTNYYEGQYTIKYQEDTPNSIGAKLVCIDDRLILPLIIALINLLNGFLNKKNGLLEYSINILTKV